MEQRDDGGSSLAQEEKRNETSEREREPQTEGGSNDGSCSVPYHTRFIFHLHIFICNGVRLLLMGVETSIIQPTLQKTKKKPQCRRSYETLSAAAATASGDFNFFVSIQRGGSPECGRQTACASLSFFISHVELSHLHKVLDPSYRCDPPPED